MNYVRFRRHRFQVINYVSSFIARCAASFVGLFRTTSRGTLRVRLRHSTRMRFRIRYVVIHSRQSYNDPAYRIVRYQYFSFRVARPIRMDSSFTSSLTALRRLVRTLFITSRIGVALAVFLFGVHRTIVFIERQARYFHRVRGLHQFSNSFANVDFRSQTDCTGSIPGVHLLGSHVVLFPGRIFTRMGLGLTFAILRIDGTGLPFSTFYRSSTNC